MSSVKFIFSQIISSNNFDIYLVFANTLSQSSLAESVFASSLLNFWCKFMENQILNKLIIRDLIDCDGLEDLILSLSIQIGNPKWSCFIHQTFHGWHNKTRHDANFSWQTFTHQAFVVTYKRDKAVTGVETSTQDHKKYFLQHQFTRVRFCKAWYKSVIIWAQTCNNVMP